MPIDWGLSGQRILVTAASRGIGFGAARALLQEGASVVINSSDPGRLEEARRQLSSIGKVQTVTADLSVQNDIDRLVDDSIRLLGGIDALIYVTGSPKPGTFLELNYDDWLAGAKLLVVSPAYLTKRVADHMINEKIRGRMVILSSYVIREPSLTIALSSVCRIATASLVRLLARDLGSKGIRVNGILPGYIMTKRIEQIANDAAKRRGVTPEKVVDDIVHDIPLGRIGSTEELARVIVFLASELSSYVSGSIIPVDGAILRSVW